MKNGERKIIRERENEPGHFNYARVMYLFVMSSVLQSEIETDRETETDRQTGRDRGREREVMKWVTFNYACVYVCICDAQHSSVTVHRKRFHENSKF